MSLRAVPLNRDEANAVIELWHRHRGERSRYKFAIGAIDGTGELHGVAMCGRPSGRGYDDRAWLEVVRVATDGYRNACSFLYGASARAAKAMGYMAVVTYNLIDAETGASLRGAGWTFETELPEREWGTRADGIVRQPGPPGRRGRWTRALNPLAPPVIFPQIESAQASLL